MSGSQTSTHFSLLAKIKLKRKSRLPEPAVWIKKGRVRGLSFVFTEDAFAEVGGDEDDEDGDGEDGDGASEGEDGVVVGEGASEGEGDGGEDDAAEDEVGNLNFHAIIISHISIFCQGWRGGGNGV